MKHFIEQASRNIRLEEGQRAIEKLFIECYLRPGISTKELARKTLLPVPVAAAVKKELIKIGALAQDRGVRCTDAGREYIETVLGYGKIDLKLFHAWMDMESDWDSQLEDTLAQLQPHFESRPQVNVQIDQSKCTPKTSLRRALLCLREHALIGKRILCVGDDDIVSVSLGFLLKRLFPRSKSHNTTIDVVDIDERLLQYISAIAEQEGLPITCHQLDLREPLPKALHGQFDCFFTDSPYTMQGMSLFLSRGITALQQKIGLPIFFSFAHKSPDFMLVMQRQLVRMGLMVSEVIPNFNEYEGAEMIGNRGQMMLLKTTEETVAEITDVFTDPLYTGEVKRTLRTYRCKTCEQAILVGAQGDFSTIEELKSRGCPVCSHTLFDLIEKRNTP